MSTRRRPYFAPFGSVSESTLRTEDLLSAFASALSELRTSRAERRLVARASQVDPDSEEAPYLVDGLQTALEEHAPPLGYFGAIDGDAACFGFWLPETWPADLDEQDGLRVSDLAAVPRAFSGLVALVNDHGNATLYNYTRGRRRELWSLV